MAGVPDTVLLSAAGTVGHIEEVFLIPAMEGRVQTTLLITVLHETQYCLNKLSLQNYISAVAAKGQ